MKNFEHWGIKKRIFPDHNYYAVWNNLKTLRLGEGVAKELPPEFSEFYDVGINTSCNACCEFCLTGDSKISLSTGEYKEIKEIKRGDIVKSWNEKEQKIENKKVTQLFERYYEGEMIYLTLEDGNVIKITPNHKIYTKNRGWVFAKDITEDDELLKIDY